MDDPRSVAEALYDEIDDAGSVLIELLDVHAIRTGCNSSRHAGQILRGARRAGRKAIDDRAALQYVAALEPRKGRQAVGIVAMWLAGEGADEKTVHAIERRLRRKRQNEADEMDLSAAPVP
jgi:hypothetical protein